MGRSLFIKNLLEQLKKRVRGARSRGEAVRVFTRGKHPPNKTNQQKRTPTPTKTTKTKANPPKDNGGNNKKKRSFNPHQPTHTTTHQEKGRKKNSVKLKNK